MQIKSGRYHTLLVNGSSVYSCGSSLCGVLGHGSETTQCVAFTRISFPSLAQVTQVSASHNHAAFVMQTGEVCMFTLCHTLNREDNRFISHELVMCYINITSKVSVVSQLNYRFLTLGFMLFARPYNSH